MRFMSMQTCLLDAFSKWIHCGRYSENSLLVRLCGEVHKGIFMYARRQAHAS